ncbi:DUF932 domain-containing protein (plasmid) [Kovacikia minuta CCNUW1]|uniref:DUF932 domain-containing protein n=1 Tax=Kovacikia minuta TaxID=2931930 RepID=UPI001CCBC462|nr:DUF932 domain-containing protein [Kovacikia minuta]UBF29925.1 DUF932 domain-containing protein [Kovacikia minuta CCNUW1]
MSNKLMLHCGAFQASLSDVKSAVVPEATRTYTPLPHYQMLEWIFEEADKLNLTPKKFPVPSPLAEVRTMETIEASSISNPVEHLENCLLQPAEIGLTKDGNRMFFLVEFEQEYEGHNFAVGGRNSYDKTLAAGLTAGARNFICDNTALSGDYVVLQKHHGQVNFENLIKSALLTMPARLEKLINRINSLKDERIDMDEARKILIQAGKTKVIPSSDIIPVWEEYLKPTHEEFQEFIDTKYGLLQSFTEVVKKENSAMTLMQRHARFADLFQLDANLN